MQGLVIVLVFVMALLAACDTQVPQTVVVRAEPANASVESLWLVTDDCEGDRIKPGWYRNGLWIFRLSSTRGGVGTTTQELALCYQGNGTTPIRVWHSLHGGGAPFIVLSCDRDAQESCALYMDQHSEGACVEPPK